MKLSFWVRVSTDLTMNEIEFLERKVDELHENVKEAVLLFGKCV